MKRFMVSASTDSLLDAFKKDCERFKPEWLTEVPFGEDFVLFNLDNEYGVALRYATSYFTWKSSQVELKPPRQGELAIFWDDNKKEQAIICELAEILDSTNEYAYVTKQYNLRFKNAALFESIEHYNKFKNS